MNSNKEIVYDCEYYSNEDEICEFECECSECKYSKELKEK